MGTRRGLRGVKLVIADDHKGLKAAATRILGATAQRCRVHFMRNLLAHAGKQGRRVVSAFVAIAFAQDDADSAAAQWRPVADQLKPKAPKLAALNRVPCGGLVQASPNGQTIGHFPLVHAFLPLAPWRRPAISGRPRRC